MYVKALKIYNPASFSYYWILKVKTENKYWKWDRPLLWKTIERELAIFKIISGFRQPVHSENGDYLKN